MTPCGITILGSDDFLEVDVEAEVDITSCLRKAVEVKADVEVNSRVPK